MEHSPFNRTSVLPVISRRPGPVTRFLLLSVNALSAGNALPTGGAALSVSTLRVALVLLACCVGACTLPERSEHAPPSSYGKAAPDLHPSTNVPEWAKYAVWYQIFPERFANGDPSNDPTADDLTGSWPHITPENWQISRWTSDWYARPEWERDTHDDFYVTVQLRRYGGDIQGIINRLDYLDSLGVTALYLNPVFESPSLHKYDGASYHHIDDNFGPNPTQDRRLIAGENPTDPSTWIWTSADRLFLELIRRTHSRDMKIIIDGVFNHMGLRSFAFEDLMQHQQQSRFRDWFAVTSWDDPATPDTSEFDYQGWVGVRELPELQEDENGLIPPVRNYIFASVHRWMDPNADGDPSDGVDGWRLDVAEMVEIDFWTDFREYVRSINPDAYLVGEVWWKDWSREQMFDAAPWLRGHAFDAVMNYRWARASRRFFLGSDLNEGQLYNVRSFRREILSLLNDYPPENNFVLMNTYSSHDTDRLASQVLNPGFRFDHNVSPNADRNYNISAPDEAAESVQRLMLVHQFTFVGAPHVFYGEEAGMWGADDPDERKPMVWPDMDYDVERADPFGRARDADTVDFNHGLFEFYRTLAHVRTNSKALSNGSLRFLPAGQESRLLAYERQYGVDFAWVAINAGPDSLKGLLPFTTSVPPAGHSSGIDYAGQRIVDRLTGDSLTPGPSGFRVDLPPMSARIWTPLEEN